MTNLLTYEELTDRTHTRIVSFIVLDYKKVLFKGQISEKDIAVVKETSNKTSKLYKMMKIV